MTATDRLIERLRADLEYADGRYLGRCSPDNIRALLGALAASQEKKERLEKERDAVAQDIETFWKPQFDEQCLRAEAAEAQIETLSAALEEFGASRVRDRVAARVGCNHDILHDALKQEVKRALQHIDAARAVSTPSAKGVEHG